MKKAKIIVTQNGPYKIAEFSKVVNSKGAVLSKDNELYLCRCGGSGNKPFCDGTHKKNGFLGENSEAYIENKTVAYKGEKITIYDNRSVCSHRGYCTGELPTVFKETDPWINPDGDSIEKIMALCDKCPSGALSYSLPDEARGSGKNNGETVARLSEKHFGFHGPYDISGIAGISGQLKNSPELENKMTLCRCGHSKNKPYCSGEHYYIEFIDHKNDDE